MNLPESETKRVAERNEKRKRREIDMDQIFYNGNIHIMDEARTVVSALEVKDARVAAIGSD